MLSISRLLGNVSVGNILEEMYSFEKDPSFSGVVDFSDNQNFFFILFHLIESYQKKLHPMFIDPKANPVYLKLIKEYLIDNSEEVEDELFCHVHQWFSESVFSNDRAERLSYIDLISLKYLNHDYRSTRQLDTLFKLLALTMDTEDPTKK